MAKSCIKSQKSHLAVSALVDKLTDGLEVGVAPGDVWLLWVEESNE